MGRDIYEREDEGQGVSGEREERERREMLCIGSLC